MSKLKLFNPPAFKVTDIDRLQNFIKQYNFCTLITHTTDSVSISHSPAHIPHDYKDAQTDYNIGFEIPITELVGKFKLGQNRSNEDQQGLIEGLTNQQDPESKMLADFIAKQKHNI
jgi:predicted FMN-binding regulatory protein PaiB